MIVCPPAKAAATARRSRQSRRTFLMCDERLLPIAPRLRHDHRSLRMIQLSRPTRRCVGAEGDRCAGPKSSSGTTHCDEEGPIQPVWSSDLTPRPGWRPRPSRLAASIVREDLPCRHRSGRERSRGHGRRADPATFRRPRGRRRRRARRRLDAALGVRNLFRKSVPGFSQRFMYTPLPTTTAW
jgi:hypothetical protein